MENDFPQLSNEQPQPLDFEAQQRRDILANEEQERAEKLKADQARARSEQQQEQTSAGQPQSRLSEGQAGSDSPNRPMRPVRSGDASSTESSETDESSTTSKGEDVSTSNRVAYYVLYAIEWCTGLSFLDFFMRKIAPLVGFKFPKPILESLGLPIPSKTAQAIFDWSSILIPLLGGIIVVAVLMGMIQGVVG